METNRKYKIKVEVGGTVRCIGCGEVVAIPKLLSYSSCLVTHVNDKFVSFIDSHTDKEISYNLNSVVFYEEEGSIF